MKRSEEFYEGDREAVLSTAGRGETMQAVLDRRWSRRAMVKGATGSGLVLTLGTPALAQARQTTPEASPVTAAAPLSPERSYVCESCAAGDAP